MRKITILILAGVLTLPAFAQQKDAGKAPDSSKQILSVDAACGQCKFGLPGNTCDLAVRIDGKAYFVDGSGIDDHGDAHAKDGFCNAVRKATVQGQIVDNRFQATYFRLAEVTAKKKNLANN